MPRSYRHSRATIHNHQSNGWDQLEPLASLPLSPDQIREKRIELVEEMLGLLLADTELARQQRQALTRISASLGAVRTNKKGANPH
jgi:hypothetical protein